MVGQFCYIIEVGIVYEKKILHSFGHDRPTDEPYSPSAEVVRLTNAINRGLESPDEPESLIDLTLQGSSARYDRCPASMKDNPFNRPAKVDFKRFGQATRTGPVVSQITISAENAVTV